LTTVTFSDVALQPDKKELAEFRLDQPTAGTSRDDYAITFEGQVVARRAPPVALELSGRGVHGVLLPIGVPTPDITQLHPDIPWAASNSGFRTGISALGLPANFEFKLSVVLADERILPLATIRGRRESVPVSDATGIQPIVVTTLGRSGSELVMKLLGTHPDIVVYPLGVTELKVATYWTEVFSALIDPRSYLQPVTSAIRPGRWWLGDAQPYHEDVDDPDLIEWLGAAQVSEIASFCKGRIDAFYERLIELEGGGRPRYFAEKMFVKRPPYVPFLGAMYPKTREIILVRDFRDMLCSMFAYSRRVGSTLFGREMFSTDEEFVRNYVVMQLDVLKVEWQDRSDSAYLLRYEDLILEPQKTLRSLLAHLELDSSDDVMDSLLSELTPSDDGAGKPSHVTSTSVRDSIGRWREELDPSLQSVCEEVLGEALGTFGYSR
jgi:hypothetical protein